MLQHEQFGLKLEESYSHGIVIEDSSSNRIIACNPEFAKILDASVDEVINKSFLSIYASSCRHFVTSQIAESDRSGEITFEAKIQRKNGEHFPVRMNIVSVRNENGDLLYRVGTVQDTTRYQEIKEEIIEIFELLEQSYDAIITWDIDDGILSWNKNAEKLYGYKSEEVLKLNPHTLLKTVFSEPFPDFIEKLRKTKHWHGEIVTATKGGRKVFVETRMTVIQQHGNSIVVENGRDITERKITESKLMRASQLGVVGELAAGLAHEIKNPLTGIKGVMEILIRDLDKEEKSYEMMQSAMHQIDRIDKTIRELLNRARFRPLCFEKVSLNETVQRAVHIARHQTFLKKEQLQNNFIKLDLPEQSIMAPHDKSQIEDAILNLILNAKKHIDKKDGSISVSLKTGQSNNGAMAVIKVSDNGTGISEKDLPKIFTPFFTTDKDGTGLGLSAVRRIINAHNGICEVQTASGKGTTFLLSLPITPHK